MQIFEASNFQTLLEKRRGDFPQAIVAGWMMPDGRPVGSCAQVCEETPTDGQLAVAYACCLAACFKKIDELMEGKSDEQREQLMGVVKMLTDGLDVVDRFASGLVSEKALAGASVGGSLF